MSLAASPTEVLREAPEALDLSGVTKRFRGLVALRDVSFGVREGAIHGVIGPNGSGKTTLFNVVNGLYPIDGGTVRVFGRDVTGWPPWRLARLGVSRTFQNLRLFGRMTVLEQVLVALDPAAVQNAWRYVAAPRASARRERRLREEALEILRQFELEGAADELATSLPYGHQRRVELARAIASRPRLLLLDEPAAGLTPGEVEVLAAQVAEIRRKGVTVVLIDHNMAMVMNLCDRVTVLSEGRVLTEGTPGEVAHDPEVVRVYLGSEAEP